VTGIDRDLVHRFVALAADSLQGDWVVMGGAVLPLLGVETRVTWDIDVAGPPEARMDQALLLMEIAEELGLPVEAINQAGAYFLHRVDGWRESLVKVRVGKSGTILRPDATLFVLLKIDRLTESDLADCTAMLDAARRLGETVRSDRLAAAIEAALEGGDLAGERRARLEALLGALPG
jgi:hypothetical protein